jgi:hypothetical protein
MKRLDLIRHLERHGCEFMREGGNHTIYVNRTAKKFPLFPVTAKFSSSLRGKSAKTWKSRVPETGSNGRIAFAT